jgi:hypothetical protein
MFRRGFYTGYLTPATLTAKSSNVSVHFLIRPAFLDSSWITRHSSTIRVVEEWPTARTKFMRERVHLIRLP